MIPLISKFVKVIRPLLSFSIVFFVQVLYGQDSSFRQSPSGLSVAEGRLSYVNLLKDYKNQNSLVGRGRFAGLGASFSSNLFSRVNEHKRFRQGDFEGLGFGLGAGGKGFWLNARVDLGWQFHYALTKHADLGFRTYGVFIIDKIPFSGVMFHPSFKLRSLYLDYLTGAFVKIGNSLKRNYQEINFRFLLPNERSDDYDRWYVGFKAVQVKGINSDLRNSTTRMNQGHITLGLML